MIEFVKAGRRSRRLAASMVACVAVAALAAGCSGTESPSPPSPTMETITPAAAPEPSPSPSPEVSVSPSPSKDPVPSRFETVEELRDALIAGGYDCPAWKRDDRVTLALQSGECSTQDVLMIFTGESAVHEAVQNFKEMGTTVVVGENWIVNPRAAITVTHAIGGTIVRGEEPSAPAEVRLTPEESIFLANVRTAHEAWPDGTSSDELVLLTADVACVHLGTNDFGETVDFMVTNMPGSATAEQAADFTILSVMAFCSEHGSKLPG